VSLQQLTAQSAAAAATVFQLNAIGSACLTAAQAVLEQGGLVNKIMMDEKGLCLIYAFGTPGCSFEDNSLRALRVGCAILTRLGPLPHSSSSSGGSSKRPRAYNTARRQSFSAGSGSAAGASTRRGSVRASSSGSAAAVAAAAAAECTASIGVATGQVCAALLGLSTVRCEYALVGDTVNLAARLAAHAHATGHGLLACPSTMVRAISLVIATIVTIALVP
jgi:class 3 adenylate cyclase